MSFALSQYRQANVNTASPVRIVVQLYDGALRFLREAMDAHARADLATRGAKLGRAHAVVSELRATLHHDQAPELCDQLEGLYDFILDRIGEAAATGDAQVVGPAVEVLTTLRDAWATLAEQTR
ncbi:MAG TPA: flagellar export chaperone FliS [Polyangiaceae bacterium LLY-WYZ-14_1]|nr:flagellar export chaperone FliS [Polyangiaceae bacterium LLY-WYZ-14_1]